MMRDSMYNVGLIFASCLLAFPASGSILPGAPPPPVLRDGWGKPTIQAQVQSTAVQTGSEFWKRLAPFPRYGHITVYDPTRDRMLSWGGRDDGSALTEVLYLPLAPGSRWGVVPTTGQAPKVTASAAIFDPVRDRLLVFGGYIEQNPYLTNGVWSLDLKTYQWNQLEVAGTLPSRRGSSTGVYDPVRDAFLIFGSDHPLNDVWSLSLSGTPTWQELLPMGQPPSPRYGQSMIYDPPNDRVIIFGGYDISFRNDIFALSLAGQPTWTELVPEPGSSIPYPRYAHGGVYDLNNQRMIVIGGYAEVGYFDEAWALDLNGPLNWTFVGSSGAGSFAVTSPGAIWDPVRARIILFAGYAGWRPAWASRVRWETWQLSGNDTLEVLALHPQLAPFGRYGANGLYDPKRNQLIVWGGEGVSFATLSDTWSLSLDEPSESWTLLVPSNGYGVYDAGIIYDPIRDRAISFGGKRTGAHNDVRTLSLQSPNTGWTTLSTIGDPPDARWSHSAIYDPIRDRIIVFGGALSETILANDTWALSLSGTPSWQDITPAGPSPLARAAHSAIYDPIRDRMIVFGGYPGLNDTWSFNLSGVSAWTQLSTGTPIPAERSGQSAIYDPVRDQMIVYGGSGGSGFSDTWALQLELPYVWNQLLPSGPLPAKRGNHCAVYDALSDRMIVYGGSGPSYSYLSDVWYLALNPNASSVGEGPITQDVFRVRPLFPNPSRGLVRMQFSIPSLSYTDVSIYDISGRLVKVLFSGELSEGLHEMGWNGTRSDGSEAPAGVYFSVVRWGDQKETQKLVVRR